MDLRSLPPLAGRARREQFRLVDDRCHLAGYVASCHHRSGRGDQELFSGQLITHHGEHYRIDTARLYSLPDSPPPVYMSGFGEKAIKLAARLLPLPRHFAQLSELVSEDMISALCGPSPDEHIKGIRAYTDAGFDEVYVSQVGSGHAGFFEFYAGQVLPRLRET